MRTFIPIAAAALFAACTTADAGFAERASADTSAAEAPGTPAGEPVDCLTLRQIDRTKVVNNEVVDFFTKDHRVYRNQLAGNCAPLAVYEKFAYDTKVNRLCSSDTITVFDNSGHRGPTCLLGKFQPIDAPRDYH